MLAVCGRFDPPNPLESTDFPFFSIFAHVSASVTARHIASLQAIESFQRAYLACQNPMRLFASCGEGGAIN
jgi:hypothetical protein